jgi:hypothetical protein
MCMNNKKCKTCSIAGLFNNNKMKKPKLNFKGISSSLVGGASGAAVKMGVNAIISTVDKNGVLSGMKKHLVSLALPIVGTVLMPKVFAKPLVANAVIGHNAITIFQAAQEVLPADIAAKVSGYDPYAMAGYSPYSMAGNGNLPFQTKAAQANNSPVA